MELHVIPDSVGNMVILLDDEMRIVKPVYNYLKFQRQKGMALNTLKANGSDLRTFWKFLNSKVYSYDNVTSQTIAEFVDYLRRGDIDENVIGLYVESARTAKTINRILSTVHQFYKYCGFMQEIDNPIIMDEINRPQNMFKSLLHHARTDNKTAQSIFKLKESHHTVRLLTEEEAKSFYNALTRTRDKLLFMIMYLTGARIQEALDLKIEVVPVPDSTKQVGIFRQIKSKGKYRDLYVPMSLIEEIDSFIINERSNIYTEHSYIFISGQRQNIGNHLTYRGIYEVFKNVQKKTGIFFNFHDLRHTFISNLVQSGMDISLVSIIAGHKNISTTQEYTHLSNSYIEDNLTTYWEQSIMFKSEEK